MTVPATCQSGLLVCRQPGLWEPACVPQIALRAQADSVLTDAEDSTTAPTDLAMSWRVCTTWLYARCMPVCMERVAKLVEAL